MEIKENESYLKQEIDRLQKENTKLKQDIQQMQKKNLRLQTEAEMHATAYENLSNSKCWRMTYPLRKVMDSLKALSQQNRHARLIGKGVDSLRRYGLAVTYQKVRLKLRQGKDYQGIVLEGSRTIDWHTIKPLEKCNKKIAIHIHLFYVDLLDEFINYLNNMPYSFDLFISTRESEDIDAIKAKCSQINHIGQCQVRAVANRGRDLAPLYVEFGKEIQQYDYFLHVHSKKSLYTGTEQKNWRNYSMETLLGSPEQVKKIFGLFAKQSEKVGLFYPEPDSDFPMWGLDWLSNEPQGRYLLSRLYIQPEQGLFYYPAGSFFWARVKALQPIFDLKLSLKDFPEEQGQTDGTLAHALERVIQFAVIGQGHNAAIYDMEAGCISMNRSLKKFLSYFYQKPEQVISYLSAYDIITFDIFDTLITRNIYEPDDLFRLMDKVIKKNYHTSSSFLTLRKDAEAMAVKDKGSFCCLDDIYDSMAVITGWQKDQIEAIKQLEIQLECTLAVPRRDMQAIIRKLRSAGKKIILISDMYLPENIIRQLLSKCGYQEQDFDQLWLSCSLGLRKDDGTMWDRFFAQYGQQRTIHVGDNTRSDIQMVADRHHDTFFVMNPRYQLKLSPWNSLISSFGDTVDMSICKGMVVNGMLFNSPFALGPAGKPLLREFFHIGFTAFGLLLTGFMAQLHKITDSKVKLLFLARDAYLLKKIYNLLYPKQQTLYFLTSRRAASVAAIKDAAGIKTILQRQYKGKLFNLLEARLGYQLPAGSYRDISVEMPHDLDKVMKIIKDHIPQILAQAAEETRCYQEYIQSQLTDTEQLALVDLGYAGTIQSYLKKLLSAPMHGYYLVCRYLMQIKDEEYTSLYSEDSPVFGHQLFLEAALQAPFGQLICFQAKDSQSVQPVFKQDDQVSDTILQVQQGIMSCAEAFHQLIELTGDLEIPAELAEAVLAGVLDKRFTDTGTSLEAFSVQDDYCSNGSLKFQDGRWVVR